MAETIALEIVTPDGLKLKEAVSELTAPSVEGEFGVLPQHRPMLAALATGIVRYIQNGKSTSVAVGPGFVEVGPDKALLLTDRFIKQEDIDAVRARLDLKDADEKLDAFKGDPESAEYAELVEREAWAAAQLELHGDPPPPRIRSTTAVAAEDYAKTAQAEDAAEAAPEGDSAKH